MMQDNKIILELTEQQAREINLSLNSLIDYFRKNDMEVSASCLEQTRSVFREQAGIFNE